MPERGRDDVPRHRVSNHVADRRVSPHALGADQRRLDDLLARFRVKPRIPERDRDRRRSARRSPRPSRCLRIPSRRWRPGRDRGPRGRGSAGDRGASPPEDAEGYYGEALALAGELGMRPLVAHCHLGLGKLYRRTGKRDKAREHLATVATMYREMDMRFWLEQAEAEMRELA